jgi:probable HAF family extracellular repeat protein
MKKWFSLLIAVFALVTLSVSAWAQSATFHILKTPDAPWTNYALSRNGKVMAANLAGEIYRWSSKTGFVDLGPSDPFNTSIGISADGSAIITSIVGPDGNTNPGIWKQSTGWASLGHPKNGCVMDGNWGSGWSLNADGSMAVGLAWYCPGAQGFRWTAWGGMVGLGHPAGASSRASAISADSSTIVGFYENPKTGERRAVRWSAGKKKELFTGNKTPGEATAVSSDGSRIVGQAADASGYGRAFYYTDAAGLVPMGTVSGNDTDQSVANGVSDQGMVIGWSGDPFWGGVSPFIWSAQNPATPMASLQDYLTAAGARIPKNVYLITALAISADGSTIVGTWMDANYNQGTWMAHLK